VIALGAFAAWLAATPRGQSIAGCGRSAIEDALHASASPSALDEEDAGVETEDEVEDAGGALAATTVDGPDAGMGAFAQADYDAGETVQPGDELDAGSAVASADRPDAGRRRRAAGGVVGRGGRGPGGVIRRPDF